MCTLQQRTHPVASLQRKINGGVVSMHGNEHRAENSACKDLQHGDRHTIRGRLPQPILEERDGPTVLIVAGFKVLVAEVDVPRVLRVEPHHYASRER